MSVDERISKTQHKISAWGYSIVTILLGASLIYRSFYLKQPISEYWDIALIYFLGSMYVSLAGFAKGAVQANTFNRIWSRVIPAILITIVLVNWYLGNIHTILDFAAVVFSAFLGLSFVALLGYGLYRRWERRNELVG